MEYHRERGKCYCEMKNFNMALLEYRQMLRIDPDNETNLIIFREALFESGLLNEYIEGR